MSSVEVKVFKLNYEDVIGRVKEYAERLVLRGRAEAVILFGSLARGNYTPSSDIDLLIVVKGASENPVDRITPYIDPTLPLDVQPRVFTVEELIKMGREKRRFVKEVIEHGKLIAGDESTLLKVKELVS